MLVALDRIEDFDVNAPDRPRHAALAEMSDLSARPSWFGTGKVSPPGAKTQEEQDAAWARLVNAMHAGWRSDEPKMTRDEMHERW